MKNKVHLMMSSNKFYLLCPALTWLTHFRNCTCNNIFLQRLTVSISEISMWKMDDEEADELDDEEVDTRWRKKRVERVTWLTCCYQEWRIKRKKKIYWPPFGHLVDSIKHLTLLPLLLPFFLFFSSTSSDAFVVFVVELFCIHSYFS